MKELIRELNERINGLSKQNYNLILYVALYVSATRLYSIYQELLARYYGYAVEELIQCDLSEPLVILSIVLAILCVITICKLLKHIYKYNSEDEIIIIMRNIWMFICIGEFTTYAIHIAYDINRLLN